jgi:predicted DNA-binding transcriptional regulator AlpA
VSDSILSPVWLRDRDVATICAVSRSQIWKWAATADESGFPRPIKLPGCRAARWEAAAVRRWIERVTSEQGGTHE